MGTAGFVAAVALVLAGAWFPGSEAGGTTGAAASPGPVGASAGPGAEAPPLAVADDPDPEPQPAYGTYAWPVRGPVIRSFDPPSTPYGSGHRGIDIGVPMGTPVRAASDGVVAFAGPIGGALYVSIDHPDGVRTTYSWLGHIDVKRGADVAREEVIGSTAAGHPGTDEPHLHLGARIGEVYIDPMLLLERGSVVGLVHLAPLE